MAHLILQVKRFSFCLFFLAWSSTASSPSTVFILSHSFVRRLSSHLSSSLNTRASEHFLLLGNAIMHLHGVGGRSVVKIRPHDLGVVSALKLDIIILEIGINDLVDNCPEV